MKKIAWILLITISLAFKTVTAQENRDYTSIDIMLVRGDFIKVIDTCRQILSVDSLNSEIYYKLGLAFQNFLPDDKSFDCFLKAATISPDNNMYKFMVAKGFYSKGKYNQARPLLETLCKSDSMNWTYAYYLTSIHMQEKNYDESLRIYKRFYEKDSSDYIILDKIGFAMLRKDLFLTAIEYYNRSLAIKKENVGSIKNLSFLYASTQRSDTALKLLTMGMKIDPTDMDLYVRRAALNFTLNYTKRALDDYLKILASGDSTVLYLKRSGIGYSNNLQPKEAVKYLLLAFKKDSSDSEVSRFLGQNYKKLNDLKKSAYYYNHIIKTLTPAIQQFSYTYISLAEVLKADSLYTEAIAAYLKSHQYFPNVGVYMFVANVYDEMLNNEPKAIYYYQLFMDDFKKSEIPYQSAYIESIRKRLEYLKEKQLPAKN